MKPILFAALALILAGCGSVRKSSTTYQAKTDSTASTRIETRQDSSKNFTAATTESRVRTRSIDTTVRVKGDSLSTTIRIVPGSTKPQVDTTESGGMRIITTHDPTNGTIKVDAKAKDKDVPVNLQEKDEHTKSDQKSASTTGSTQAAAEHTVTTKIEVKEKAKAVRRDPPWFSSWWIWLILVVLAVIIYRNRLKLQDAGFWVWDRLMGKPTR